MKQIMLVSLSANLKNEFINGMTSLSNSSFNSYRSYIIINLASDLEVLFEIIE